MQHPVESSSHRATNGKTLIFVPTYNELENAGQLIEQIQALQLKNVDLLFCDDNSPDGTGKLLDQLTQKYTNLNVVHRTGKLGIGTAHLHGIRWAYDHGYESLVTMDCDFTHPPKYIPEIIAAAEGNDIVVGSRYLQTKSLQDWNLWRKSLTTIGHLLTTRLLKMKYDATGGFRFYRLTSIPRYAFDLVGSRGYSFFFESLYILHLNGFKISEIPIVLPTRTYGHSKMDTSEIFKSVRFLGTISLTTLLNREKFKVTEPLKQELVDQTQQDKQGWDDYWENQKATAGGLMYDTVAAFYRKFIIKRTLNYFITQYLPKDAKVLHAGCGSGQVDTDIRNHVKITGLDISVNALNFYKKTNQGHCEVLHGSIFKIPLPDHSIDGVYNLGVMEHFTESEIDQILGEFSRVLKPGGRAVIFWPPEFGASVLFFKGLTFIFKNFLGKPNVKFHPDEITRVRSKTQVVEVFQKAGFKVLRYYFGAKDLFTYSIIVAERPALSLKLDTTSTSGKTTGVTTTQPGFTAQSRPTSEPSLQM